MFNKIVPALIILSLLFGFAIIALAQPPAIRTEVGTFIHTTRGWQIKPIEKVVPRAELKLDRCELIAGSTVGGLISIFAASGFLADESDNFDKTVMVTFGLSFLGGEFHKWYLNYIKPEIIEKKEKPEEKPKEVEKQ